MILRSSPIKAICLTSSAALLLAASQFAISAPQTELEGGGEAMQARIGSRFEDMAAGTLESKNPLDEMPDPEPPTETAQTTPEEVLKTAPEEVAKTTPHETTKPQVIAETTPEATPIETQDVRPTVVASTSTTNAAEPVKPSRTPTAQTFSTTRPAEPSALAAVQAPALTAIVTSTPSASVSPTQLAALPSSPTLQTTRPTVTPITPVTAPETLRASEPDSAAPANSMRPRPRDPAKAAQIAAAQPKPKVAKPKQSKPKPRAQARNAKRNNTQGAEAGTQTAKARTQGTNRKKASQSGNAKASNYPGLVMRRIARVPKPRVNNRGTAVISFSVSANGRLASASVARSSGSSALDKAALRVVRQASPFPKPPAGAQRRFSIRIKGS